MLVAWRRAMGFGPFGADVVSIGGRYLGAWLAAAARGVFRFSGLGASVPHPGGGQHLEEADGHP
eukprot:6686294-Lingulodinium_polyedra.AAC.1